jgi:DNA-binding response OmpR family regulator
MKKILLVEDTISLAENMADILRNQGFEVAIASNGKEAMTLLHNFKPDLILTDVFMPIMDGLQFTENLRTVSEYSQIPVIMLSAHATAEDVRRGLQAGANEYLKKPCTVEQLENSVRKLLRL